MLNSLTSPGVSPSTDFAGMTIEGTPAAASAAAIALEPPPTETGRSDPMRLLFADRVATVPRTFESPTTLVLLQARPKFRLPRHVEVLDASTLGSREILRDSLVLPDAGAPFSRYRFDMLYLAITLLPSMRHGCAAQTCVCDTESEWRGPNAGKGTRIAELLRNWMSSAGDPLVAAYRGLSSHQRSRVWPWIAAVGTLPVKDAGQLRTMRRLRDIDPPSPGDLDFPPALRMPDDSETVDRSESPKALDVLAPLDDLKPKTWHQAWEESLRALEVIAADDSHRSGSPLPIEEGGHWAQALHKAGRHVSERLWTLLEVDPACFVIGCRALGLAELDRVLSATARAALGGRATPAMSEALLEVSAVAYMAGLPEWQTWFRLYGLQRRGLDGIAFDPAAPFCFSQWAWAKDDMATLLRREPAPAFALPACAKGDRRIDACRRLGTLLWGWVESAPTNMESACRNVERERLESFLVFLMLGAAADAFADEGSAVLATADRLIGIAQDRQVSAPALAMLLHRTEGRNDDGTSPFRREQASGWNRNFWAKSFAFRHLAQGLGVARFIEGFNPCERRAVDHVPS